MTDQPDASNQPAILREAAERFLSDGPPERVEVELSPELRQRLRALAEAQSLTEAEAIRMTVAAGLAFLTTERALQVATELAGRNPEDIERLLSRHIELEGNYAVLKHRLWLALQDNQAMSLRDGALTGTVRGLEGLVKRLQAENAELQAANAALREKIPAERPPDPPTPPTPTSGEWWARLLARLRGVH